MNTKIVLHLINGTCLLGAERVAITLARDLPPVEFKAFIGVVNGDVKMQTQLRDELAGSDVDIANFSKGGIIRKIFHLIIFINENKIGLIHSHGYKSNFIALLLNIFFPRIRIVATNHTYKLTTFRARIYRLFDLLIMRFFHSIVAVSDEALNDMRDGGFPVSRVNVIDNGINVVIFSRQKSRKLLFDLIEKRGEGLLLGIVASLTPEKAHTDLLRGFSCLANEFPEMCLLIFGDGPLRQELEEMVKKLSLCEKVRFLGYRANISQLLPGLDIFILPSHQEGLPISLLEAMASNVPVIASSVGAVSRVIEHQKHGLLFEPGNVDQLSKSISLLAGDSDLRKQFALAGFNRVRENFSSKRMVQNYIEEYFSSQVKG